MRKWDEHARYVGYVSGVPERRVYISIELSAAMSTNPLTVRSDLDHEELAG
jgi:hypothetical protein